MTLAARLAPRLPSRWVGAGAALLYPRFEPELRRLADFCPRGGTAVDVGGWYGPWSRRMARRADRVVTVEPVPHLARQLAAGAPANVTVVQAAATDRTGEATLWLPPGGRGDRGVSSLVRREVHGTALAVRCVPLDDLLDGLRLADVGLIKVDVDGSELAVLRGAERTLRRDRPALFIELEVRIQPLGPVLSLLNGHGYDGWVLPRATWVPLSSFDLTGHQYRRGHVAEHGLLRRSLAPHRRYVNSVLFLPSGHRPRPAIAPSCLRALPTAW
ncbi:FkbM family methyltransferase [Streptomyces sp. NPDC051776]|uniref:FkbM family methyltransferase n=1 Tax=Streptomyces sp. NPDC051776 TaxID=3155414 RepID=UPI00341D22AB